MKTVSDLFDAFNGPTAVARTLGVNTSTASEMKRRGSIPSEYWVQIVNGAARAGVEGVTYELLARLHARRGKRSDAGAAA